MAMGVSQNHNLGHRFPLYSPFHPHPSPHQRFSLKSIFKDQRTFKKQIKDLVWKWSFNVTVRDVLKAVDLCRGAQLVHVVKEGETLSSISKQYGVHIYMIAIVNRDIVDLDLVYEGQHLRIPALHRRAHKTESNRPFSLTLNLPQIRERASHTMRRLSSQQKNKNFTTLIPQNQKLPPAKATGYFLVLVPLIAFCIRCIIGVFCAKTGGPHLRSHFKVHELKEHSHGTSRNMRWKSALLDAKEPDIMETELAEDLNISAEDNQMAVSTEEVIDMSGEYKKLEKDYQKFLSECGIADRGHWRGGLPQ